MTSQYPASKHLLKTFQHLRGVLPRAEADKPQIILLAGEVTPFRNDTDRELVFRQESNFFYITGCTVPASFALASYTPGSDAANLQLFIPKPTLDDLTWSPAPPTLEEAQASLDVTSVAHPPALPEALTQLLTQLPGALVHTLPKDSPLFPKLGQDYVDLVLNFQTTGEHTAVTDAYLLRALHQARLTKDEEEIAMIRKANAISSRAHEVIMRVLGKAVREKLSSQGQAGKLLLPGDWLIEKEAEAEAIFVASCRREGSVHQAYLPIVAASTRASTLHYCCNDREFSWGPVGDKDHLNRAPFAQHISHSEGNGHAHVHTGDHGLAPQVLLLDAGCEWDCYGSDITRTTPVGNGGKFTEVAGNVYDLVLEMQKESFKIIKAGLHWDAVQLICHRTLIKGFLKFGIFKAASGGKEWTQEDEDVILASGVSGFFFPHGVGHSLGMDVHDVPSASKPDVNPTIEEWRAGLSPLSEGQAGWGHESLYRYLRLRLPLATNMVVTVEPGVYFSPHLVAAALESPGSRFIDEEVLERYRGMGGVRIEDVVVIQPDGYENLTTVPSERSWIEAVCSGEA